MHEKQIEHRKKKKIKIKKNLGINTCKYVLTPTLCLSYVILLLLWGQNGTIALFIELYINRPLFRKYVGIYHFLDPRVWGTRVPWTQFESYFFKEPEFMELEYHGKLKYPKSSRSLHISKTVVDWYIFR